MSSTLLILRTTFRLTDNPILYQALENNVSHILIPIESNRVASPSSSVPTIDKTKQENEIIDSKYFKYNVKNLCWGYHQYYFLLQVIQSFQNDMATHFPKVQVEVKKQTTNDLIKYASQFDTCFCDVVDDPAWATFDRALQKAYTTKTDHLHFEHTHTLLPWTEGTPHHAFLTQWSKSRHNQSFKNYVYAQSDEFQTEIDNNNCMNLSSNKTVTPSKKMSRKNTYKTSPLTSTKSIASRTFHLTKERQKWKNVMEKHGIVPFDVPHNITCEKWALDTLLASVEEMSNTKWEKPKTQSVLSIREHSTTPYRTTSHLSPFLALGVVSPRVAYVHWQGSTLRQHAQNAKRPSSAIAQLLWREEFHACSNLPGFWDTRQEANRKTTNSGSGSTFWKRDVEWTTDKNDETFKNLLCARASKPVKSTSTCTLMQDTNSSVLMLVRDGWIHHLRRHVLADYVTRGHLNADWMLGEAWFRHCLLDHDASVNRGNWLWLSACDFSTAQLIRHYNHNDYVRRQSK